MPEPDAIVFVVDPHEKPVQDEAETEEVLREASLSAWCNLASLAPGARFSTWLYRIATRAALVHGPRERPVMACPVDAFLPVFDVAGRLVPGNTRWPDGQGGYPESMEVTAALLREMVQCIDDRARAAFVLCDGARLCPEEATVIVGSVATRDPQRSARSVTAMGTAHEINKESRMTTSRTPAGR
jgi:DNA-directed RNA polymerase specialized sigma24 family protein